MPPPRLVLDANQFISAMLKPDSNPGHIFHMVRQESVLLLCSPPILEEWARVFNYPKLQRLHGLSLQEQKRHLDNLATLCVLVTPSRHVDVVQNDPSDTMYLECALEGRADAIITGDKHLLTLKEYASIPILRPDQWLHSRRTGQAP
jgi:hypothetical protein